MPDNPLARRLDRIERVLTRLEQHLDGMERSLDNIDLCVIRIPESGSTPHFRLFRALGGHYRKQRVS